MMFDLLFDNGLRIGTDIHCSKVFVPEFNPVAKRHIRFTIEIKAANQEHQASMREIYGLDGQINK
jgi:hypothetical protein